MWYHNEPESHLLYMFKIRVLEYDPLAPETFCHPKRRKGIYLCLVLSFFCIIWVSAMVIPHFGTSMVWVIDGVVNMIPFRCLLLDVGFRVVPYNLLQVGLLGESLRLYDDSTPANVTWSAPSSVPNSSPLIWYKVMRKFPSFDDYLTVNLCNV